MSAHCSTRISGVLAALLLALAAIPAWAHHSAAPFDMTKSVSLQGTVEKWVWANPHSWLYIRVVKADGTQEIWGFEAGSTGMLARAGWNAADMKPGDKVTVTGGPRAQRQSHRIAERGPAGLRPSAERRGGVASARSGWPSASRGRSATARRREQCSDPPLIAEAAQ